VKVKSTIAMFTVVAALIVFFLAMSGPALTDEAVTSSPSPSPSPSVTPTLPPPPPPPPASADLVRRALKQRAGALAAYREWSRARACLLMQKRPFGAAPRPRRSASHQVWRKALVSWRALRVERREKFDLLWAKMDSTKGGGALRWAPLVRWYWNFPGASFVYTMCHISWHECGGSPFRWNFAGSGAFGIWQLLPKPSWVWRPWTQAKAAHMKYVAAGGLSPWAGCKAFVCSGNCGIY